MKYVITGGSGYIGTRLTEFLIGREDTELVAIADVKPPRYPRAKVEFHRVDVRDRDAVRALLERVKPDALVHLAFILNPIRDEAAMYDIDVNGTLYVLDAASAAGTPQVLVTSSTTAYGAWPDNQEPMTEEHVLRGQPDFAYARHKTEADRLCGLWAAEHPDRVMTIVRPCIVFGPNVDNYIVRSFVNAPFGTRFRGEPDRDLQLIHEDDLADAITRLLLGKHAGAFNATGDGTLTWQECAELNGLKVRTLPYGLAHRLAALQWRLRAKSSETPAGNLAFIRYGWVCSNRKLKDTLGWEPEHDTRETFLQTMRAKGVIPAAAGAEPRELPALKSSNGADREPVAGPAGSE